ncbi:metal ABC transporter permease [Weizmannia coagulans]|jgi:zinc transport system permease protein|uniref:ABC transporter integral membrane protein n=3 Tax=Heyndrickxia TaxID=2837504 RepID=A0A0C5CB00_HEYCO|nr:MULTISPECIES: metal ABC transporter permease [Heyndrickxia]AEP01972.1 ABC-type transporter, integral membrane subunit [Heyndrickxia coagulans 36D1]AJO22590.1 ABC transporter integral membrane protein [Heyndrickxia coagulans]AKN55886.1 Zinc ABC transporter, inner membrane permease protein ZnuB [Heyndrickxia coagulans]APB36447.1 metal ABC transporter permease [Heyndrickxia coagulans]ATW82881.1 metal ABC transporter permease [Heyndrickxia coagulans]
MIAALFHYHFLQNTFLAGILIGLIAPLIGSFIVVRRLSLIADALSHVTLSGIAISLFLSSKLSILAGLNPLYIGTGFSVLGSVLIERLRGVYRHYEELAIPIIMSGGIGIGLIFISVAGGYNVDLMNYLFGSVSAVSQADLWLILGIAVIVAAVILLLYKELFLLSFDEEYAKVSGIPAKTIHLLFMVLIALVISAAMRIVGIMLVSALITLPVAASIRISRGFKQTILFSVLFGEISVLGGLVTAFYLNLPPGGTIVVISIVILLLAVYMKRFRPGAGLNKKKV